MTLQEISNQRAKEIREGKHAITNRPIYIVYDQRATVCELSTDYDQSTTWFNDKHDYRRYSDEGSYIPGDPSDYSADIPIVKDGIKYGPVLKVSFHDSFVTVCFTRDAAEKFIDRERHNLNKPRIFVHSALYRNTELNFIIDTIEQEHENSQRP